MSQFIKSGIKVKAPNHMDKFLKELNELSGVLSSFYRGSTDSIIVEINEMWDESNFNTFFDNYDDTDIYLDAYDEYLKHEANGIEEFRKLRADSVAKIAMGQRTVADAIEIESKLEKVKAAVITGDWGTGLEKLNLVEVNSAFTQEIKDELILKIQTYINDEYVLLRP